MSNLRKSVLKTRVKRFDSSSPSFEPISWVKYFDSQKPYKVNDNSFNVYQKGSSGPLLVALHGGGYSALTWSLFTEEIGKRISCQVLAIDLRGHGDTTSTNDADLSLETLAHDVIDVVNAVYPDGESLPPIVLIGHSMGGAVAVETSLHMSGVVGVCVIDVVEGTALESLSSMQSILRSRPTSFKSMEHAIQWCFRSGQTHNAEAARVSMPGQIKNKVTKLLAANEIDTKTNEETIPLDVTCNTLVDDTTERSDVIREEEEESVGEINGLNNSATSSSKPPICGSSNIQTTTSSSDFAQPSMISTYEWRIDLSKTEPFWSGWFKGLSQKFLDVSAPKILILANIQGLDTCLTIGQMQGKFQLQVLPKSGHAIHEDQPDRVADVIAGFLVKQRLAQPEQDYCPSMPAC